MCHVEQIIRMRAMLSLAMRCDITRASRCSPSDPHSTAFRLTLTVRDRTAPSAPAYARMLTPSLCCVCCACWVYWLRWSPHSRERGVRPWWKHTTRSENRIAFNCVRWCVCLHVCNISRICCGAEMGAHIPFQDHSLSCRNFAGVSEYRTRSRKCGRLCRVDSRSYYRILFTNIYASWQCNWRSRSISFSMQSHFNSVKNIPLNICVSLAYQTTCLHKYMEQQIDRERETRSRIVEKENSMHVVYKFWAACTFNMLCVSFPIYLTFHSIGMTLWYVFSGAKCHWQT